MDNKVHKQSKLTKQLGKRTTTSKRNEYLFYQNDGHGTVHMCRT